MTQKEKLAHAHMFVMRVQSIANSIQSEGNDYDVTWHKGYCEQLLNACDKMLKVLK